MMPLIILYVSHYSITEVRSIVRNRMENEIISVREKDMAISQ